ncbi:MAG TPA: FHA domain-containing protein [Planctomycetota bacterium]|nr:FHA domain-containing protein [Planctomycetota bacterium]
MSYKLTVNFGGKTVERREVDAERYVIGRASECDLVIDNLGVSRQHAEIVMEAGVPILKDMKSNNGTYVNGKRVTRYNLNDGDEVSIGKFAITFHMEQPEEDETEAPPEEPQGERKGDFTLAIDSRLMERQREKVSKLKAYLLVQGGDKKKPIILEKSIYSFGKLATCDFHVGGFFAPPKSAFIFRDDVAFHLIDCGKGKAFLNETPVDTERLKDGDVIRVGGNKLEFHVGTPQLT